MKNFRFFHVVLQWSLRFDLGGEIASISILHHYTQLLSFRPIDLLVLDDVGVVQLTHDFRFFVTLIHVVSGHPLHVDLLDDEVSLRG